MQSLRRFAVVRRSTGILVVFLALFTLAPTAWSQQSRVDSHLYMTLWVSLEPAIAAGEPTPRSEERAAELLFTEARFVLSGMIYGYRYEFVPSDDSRRIQEEFSLIPHAEIQQGDPRLEAIDGYTEDKRVYTQFLYRLAPFQRDWLTSWQSSAVSRVQASGSVPWWDGHESKLTAVEEAVKAAIRRHLRSIVRNKPRRARGSVLLTEPPRIFVDAGRYRAEVTIRIRVDELQGYEVY
jgi:hypothetical protein